MLKVPSKQELKDCSILIDMLVYDESRDKTIILTIPPQAMFNEGLTGYITDEDKVYLITSEDTVNYNSAQYLFNMTTLYPGITGKLHVIGIL